MADVLPRRDSGLMSWSQRFSTRINADPEAVALSPEQAAAYAVLHQQFVTALTLARGGSTQGRSRTIAKNEARKALKAEARRLGRLIRAASQVTGKQRVELGLNVGTGHRSRRGAPPRAPLLQIKGVRNQWVRVHLRDPGTPTRKGRPENVIGATVLAHIGEKAPTSTTQCNFMLNTSRAQFTLEFPADLPAGTRVWLTAFYFTARMQRSPAADAACTHLGAPVPSDHVLEA